MIVNSLNKINTSYKQNLNKKISFTNKLNDTDSINLSKDKTINEARTYIIQTLSDENPIEHCILIDNKTDKVIGKCDGNSNSVRMPLKYTLLTLNPYSNITFMYGHPSENSSIAPTFSFADMKSLLLNSGIKKMYALGKNGEEYIFEKKYNSKNKHKLLQELNFKEAEFNQEMWALKGGDKLKELKEKLKAATTEEEKAQIQTEMGMLVFFNKNNNDIDYTKLYTKLDNYWKNHAKDYGVEYNSNSNQ